MNSSHFLDFEGHRLHYRVFGNGEQPFLFFHGFGQTHDTFEPPENWCDRFRFFAFDLFYHGKSEGSLEPLSLEQWRIIFLEFVKQEGLEPGQLTISGYSMGGRFVLATTILHPEYIRRVILIAPDGIYRSPFYLLANTFKPIFRYLMAHPSHFDRLLRLAEKWKFASKTLIKFSQRELGPVENRMRVYYSWTLFKPLGIPRKTIIKEWNQRGIVGHLFLGEKDYIIPVDKVLPTFLKIPTVQASILPLRHHELVNGTWSHLGELDDL